MGMVWDWLKQEHQWYNPPGDLSCGCVKDCGQLQQLNGTMEEV